jgi:hypothetical protein
MSEREILDPYWTSNLKNQVVCKFKYAEGGIVTASVSQTSEGNPDWDEIFANFTIEQIDNNTVKRLARHREVKLSREMEDQRRGDNMRREALFMAKSDAFEIELIRNSTNTQLKSRLRKATSIIEVTVLASLIAAETYNIQNAINNETTETNEDVTVNETTETNEDVTVNETTETNEDVTVNETIG